MSDTPPTATPGVCDTLTLRVRYDECDQMGIVYHPRYLTYFEMGRVEMLRRAGYCYADLERAGILLVVARAEIRYKASARYDEQLTLTTTLERVTTARIDHRYELVRGVGGQLLVEGTTTLACVDRAGQIRPIPEALRQLRN